MEGNMNKLTVRYPFTVVLVAALLMLVLSQPLAAKEDTGQVEIQGTVLFINAVTGTFQVQEQDGSVHTVVSPAGFDFSRLKVGDTVEVKGTLNADGSISASSVKIEQADEDLVDKSDSYYCVQSAVQHPVGARLAEEYDVPYATVQGWFCEGFGWGQIKHSLQTAKLAGANPADLLDARRNGQGWGQIWQGLNLVGRTRQDKSSGDKTVGPQSGNPSQSAVMKEKGKPVAAGQSNGVKANGKPAADGRSNNGKGRK
jgi:hypothetical protein